MKKVNSQAKLTHEDVEQIRQLNEWKESEIKRILSIAGHKVLAEKFGVSPTCIGHVVTYRTW
jgi:uncharacterized protein HemX